MNTRLGGSYGAAVLAFVFFIAVFSGQPARAAPQGAAACDFVAESSDVSVRGVGVRAEPNAAAQVLGYIPPPQDNLEESAGETQRGPNVHVLSAKAGWFEIEGANDAKRGTAPSPDVKGWVEGGSLVVRLYRETLKAAPNDAAPDIVYLVAYEADGVRLYSPESITVSRVFGCSGRWLEVEISLPEAKTLTGEAASANGTVRGWTDKTCAGPDSDGRCASRQFDYPWSPLPSGITECNFVAFSKDHDPAGLNVRSGPDENARILGRLPPSPDPEPYSTFGADVIGYKKGWLLIEHGFEAVWTPQRPREALYSGRGWVAANLMTTQLLRGKLKLAPNGGSPDVLNLQDVKGEGPDDSFFVTPRRILGCSGDWVHVEMGLRAGEKALVRTDARPGAVQGWANGTCASQTTPCASGQNAQSPTSPPAPLPPE